jgi:hypothetical protein
MPGASPGFAFLMSSCFTAPDRKPTVQPGGYDFGFRLAIDSR